MAAWSDKPLEDREFPDDQDILDDEEDNVLASLTPCPSCGRAVHEQTQQCPHCKQWILAGRGSWRDSRKWYVRGGLWMSRTLLWNWLFWIALSALGVLIWAAATFGRR